MSQAIENIQQKIKVIEQSLADWQQQLEEAKSLLESVQNRIANANVQIVMHRGKLEGLTESLAEIEMQQSQSDIDPSTSDNVLEA